MLNLLSTLCSITTLAHLNIVLLQCVIPSLYLYGASIIATVLGHIMKLVAGILA